MQVQGSSILCLSRAGLAVFFFPLSYSVRQVSPQPAFWWVLVTLTRMSHIILPGMHTTEAIEPTVKRERVREIATFVRRVQVGGGLLVVKGPLSLSIQICLVSVSSVLFSVVRE